LNWKKLWLFGFATPKKRGFFNNLIFKFKKNAAFQLKKTVAFQLKQTVVTLCLWPIAPIVHQQIIKCSGPNR